MHISTCLYLSLPVAFRRPASVSISISHTHTLACAYITTLSRAKQQGRAREGDGGDEWQECSNLVPQSPQLPRKKQGGQAQVPVWLRAHLAANRSGRFTGCTFVHFWLTAPALLFVCVCCKIEPNLIPLLPCSNLLSLKHKSAKEEGNRNNPLKDHMHGHQMLNCRQQNMCGIIYCVMQGIFPARFDSDLSDVWPSCFPGSQLRLLTSAVLSKLAKETVIRNQMYCGFKKKALIS